MRNFLSILILLSFASQPAFAHRGRTDASGCHEHKKSGNYHCHNGSKKYQRQNNSIYKKYSKDLVLKIQQNLNILGYDAGIEDGVFGKKTERAIIKFQTNAGYTPIGIPNQYLLRNLKERITK